MPHHHPLIAACIAVGLLSLMHMGPATASAMAMQEDPAAAEWCASHDGTVVERFPASGASTDAPTALGAPVRFCEFSGGKSADPADSRISVRLTTLASAEPSMAATAYLTKPALPDNGGSANPASVYCADLGGAELEGVLAPDGGWVNSANTSDVVQMCVFPDLSIIDSWGLVYHTQGVIRGADLTPIFRAKPAS